MTDLQRCTKCGENAVYHRAYSGERLCSRCFKESIVEKANQTISHHKMLRHGDVIAAAISGGKDSLSLLVILDQICRQHDSKLFAVTIDEGVTGYREEAAQYAKKVALNLGVTHVVLSYKDLYGEDLDDALEWKEERKVSSCSICGTLRRRSLDIAAEKVGANVIATGHNLDDVIQTFFINLLAGDVDRIWRMDTEPKPSNGFLARRIKPLMTIYEQELAYFALLSNLPFQNVKCPYMDEGIRSEIRVILNRLEEKHPGMKHILSNSTMEIAGRLRGDRGKELQKCVQCGRPSSGPVCSVCKTLKLIQLNKVI